MLAFISSSHVSRVLVCHIQMQVILIHPQGWYSEYVNPYIPTQTPEENWSDHMQSPGWQPLCVWPNVWSGDLQVLKKYRHTWHRMSSLGPGVIKQHKPNRTNNNPEALGLAASWSIVTAAISYFMGLFMLCASWVVMYVTHNFIPT